MLIAQISDTHVRIENGVTHPNAAALQRAVAHLLALPTRPDLVFLTGDATHYGAPEEYELLRELLRPLPMPLYVIPGNHDRRDLLMEAFGPQGTQQLEGFAQYVVDAGPLRVLALDTHIPGSDEGELCEARLAWLAARLDEAPDRPTIIFMHHPPTLTGLVPLDAIGFRNTAALAELVARHQQVALVSAGHVHSHVAGRFAGTLAMTCATTAHNLLPDLNQPERLVVQLQPPAYLLHAWNPQTGLASYTSHITDPSPTFVLHDGTDWKE